MPAFRQLGISAELVLAVAASDPAQAAAIPRTLAPNGPSHQVIATLTKIPASTVFHLVDESDQGEDKEAPLKRRRVEADRRAVGEEPVGSGPELTTDEPGEAWPWI